MDFSKVTKHFDKPVNFKDAHFHGYVSFRKIRFSSSVTFAYAEFLDDAEFYGATFRKDVDFAYASFSLVASFVTTKFLLLAEFTGVIFSGLGDFTAARFVGAVGFLDVDMTRSMLHFVDTEFNGRVYIDEYGWSRANFHLPAEENRDELWIARSSYHNIRKALFRIGHYDVVGELFYNEMICTLHIESLGAIIYGLWLKIIGYIFQTKARVFYQILPHRFLSFLEKIKEIIVRSRVTPRRSTFLRGLSSWAWMRIFYITCGFWGKAL